MHAIYSYEIVHVASAPYISSSHMQAVYSPSIRVEVLYYLQPAVNYLKC